MLHVQRGIMLETVPKHTLPEDRSKKTDSGVAFRETIDGSLHWRYNMLSFSPVTTLKHWLAEQKASCCWCSQACLLGMFSDATSGPSPSDLRINIILTVYIYRFSKWEDTSVTSDSLRTHTWETRLWLVR